MHSIDSFSAACLPWLTFIAIALLTGLIGGVIVRLTTRRGTEIVANHLAADAPQRPNATGWAVALAAVTPLTDAARGKIAKELKRAGYYGRLSLEEFLALRNALCLGWCLLVGFAVVSVARAHTEEPVQMVLGGVVMLLLIYSAPRLWLQSVANQRVQRIQRGLPDALDMITMCVTGGLPIVQAVERVAADLPGSHRDLALELEIIRRQADAYTLEHALAQFADRIDTPEVRSLSALVSQTQRLGTSVANALLDFADGIRRSHRQRAEERGNTTSVKLLLPIALCLAPPVYILLLAPPLLEMKSFLNRENRPGGILSPANLSPASLEGLPPAATTTTRRS